MSFKIDYDYRDHVVSGAVFDEKLRLGIFRGIVANMPNSKYHTISNYYSSTQLKYMYAHTPAHFYARYISGEIEAPDQSSEMKLGSAVHCLTLTPDEFDFEFCVVAPTDGRTKEGKAQRLLDQARAMDRIVISEEDLDIARDIEDAVTDCKKAMDMLRSTDVELAFFWQCPFTGLLFRSKIDALGEDYLIELKTAHDASPKGFERAAYNMNYDLSLAHYLEGIRVVCDRNVTPYFVVVETEIPFVCQPYAPTEAFMEVGHAKWLEAIQLLELAEKTHEWPGYTMVGGEEIKNLNPPAWAIKRGIENGI